MLFTRTLYQKKKENVGNLSENSTLINNRYLVGHENKNPNTCSTQQTRYRYAEKEDHQCFIIDISVGLDVNLTKNFSQKRNYYLPLAVELKRLYDKFIFEIIPLTIGATGLVTNDLKLMLKRIGVENIDDVTLKCQKSTLLGTVKIAKSFMKM